MIIISVHSDVDPNVAELILDKKLRGGYWIDYALNALVSYYEEKEIIIFDFNKYIILDNRLLGYHIEDYGTKIVINFKQK